MMNDKIKREQDATYMPISLLVKNIDQWDEHFKGREVLRVGPCEDGVHVITSRLKESEIKFIKDKLDGIYIEQPMQFHPNTQTDSHNEMVAEDYSIC